MLVFRKDIVLTIRWLGAGCLPKLFRFKEAIDRFADATRILPKRLSERLLQASRATTYPCRSAPVGMIASGTARERVIRPLIAWLQFQSSPRAGL